MRRWTWLTAMLFALAFAAFAQDIDSVKVDPAHHQVVFENEQVRVVHWIIAPHDKTLNHTHPNSVNIDLTDYNGKATTPAGTFDVHDKAGTVRWRPALTHFVENIGDQPMEGVIVEPKKPSSVRPTASADPIMVDPSHHSVIFENGQVRVIREQRTPGKFPMHGHPDVVQVLLTDVRATLATPDGKTEELIGKAREVRWRLATQHTGEARDDRPVEQILVEMKGAPSVRTGG